MSGSPIMLPARHLINIALAAALVGSLVMFYSTAAALWFWLIILLSFALGLDRKSVV